MDAAVESFPYESYLPVDLAAATLVGRAWRMEPVSGPCVIALRNGQVFDITASAATMSDLLESADPVQLARNAPGELLGPLERIMENSFDKPGADGGPRLLAPCDLQAIKACGVTFVVSLMERLIEERSGGDAAAAQALRADIQRLVGTDLHGIRPGSAAALRLKDDLIRQGAWSQYLEVGIGKDAEVFTKSQIMSAVGFGSDIGVLPSSEWNNPEPEVVLAVNSRGVPMGATLGNDVNLRDVEGRSALLLGKAKDNNGSCALGPFIRLFDAGYTIDSVRREQVRLRIHGEADGFVLDDISDMARISRDPLELVAQTIGPHHQYPDGFMLFLGTMFSPIQDRGEPGSGFTHRLGDRVSISSPHLGMLINVVRDATRMPPWTFGVRALYKNLAERGLPAQAPPGLGTQALNASMEQGQ
ncbi:MAG: fumarylacetoacetate hydrolase family protein [Pusillimonas sp.]